MARDTTPHPSADAAADLRLSEAHEIIYDGNVLMLRLGRYLKPYGLIPTTMGLLSRLMDPRCDAVRMTELAASLAMSMSGVTRAVDSLEAEGLIKRNFGTRDRREVMVRITEAGRRRVHEALPGYLRELDSHRQEMSPALRVG